MNYNLLRYLSISGSFPQVCSRIIVVYLYSIAISSSVVMVGFDGSVSGYY